MKCNIFFPSYHSRSNLMGTTDSDPEPHQHYEVHCGRCKWWGMTNQLKVVYRPDTIRLGGVIPTPGCPMCLSDQWLEYKEK